MKAPLLVYVPADFDDYLTSISKSARYEYRKAMRLGARLDYAEIPFDRSTVAAWMKLWEQQIVYGKRPKWASWTSPEIFEKHKVRVLFAGIALQMLEVCGDYAYAQPVLYNKTEHPWVAKFMWFKAIEWCSQHGVRYLDMDGGKGKNWRQKLKAQDGPAYKWMYVPRYVKENPDAAPEWGVTVCKCGWRTLGPGRCRRCHPSG